jgi:hypothetical protein
MTRGRTWLIAVFCLLITGCGSSHVRSGEASAARVASGAREAIPCPVARLPRSFPASPASNRNLVIAKLRGSDQTVIRDITDIEHPSTIATVSVPGWSGDGYGAPSFVSPSTISYIRKDHAGLVRLSVPGAGLEFLAFGCPTKGTLTFRWSPDGQLLTYVLSDNYSGGVFHWHLVSGGVDREIGTAPIWCFCGEGFDGASFAVGFSTDGNFVWLVEHVVNSTDLQVRRLDGSLVGSELRGDQLYPSPPTMGVWSGSDLFFRDSQGVEKWSGATIKPFLPGVAWLHPWASPTGDQIVYAVRGSNGFAHVNVVDTATGRVRQLSNQPRTWPVFLSPRYVWYRGERLCTESDGICRPTTFTGTTYIYDLETGTESESIITDIADVWPHGA